MRTALNALRGRARLVAPVLAGPRPSLLLDMMQGVLDPRIQFSRASNATRIGPDGRLEWAPANLIPNSVGSGGGPSSAPTGWGAGGASNGVTWGVVGYGAINGVNYLDVRFWGTASATAYPAVTLNPASSVPAAVGQPFTLSMSVQLLNDAAGTIGTTVLPRIEIQGQNAGLSYVEGGTATIPLAKLQLGERHSVTRTVANAASTQIRTFFNATINPGQTVDATFRVWAPQLELGSVAREFIPTSGAAHYAPRFDYSPTSIAGTVGDNIVTNSGFQGPSGWTQIQGGGLSLSGGVATVTSNLVNYGAIQQTIAGLTPGKTYQLRFTARRVTAAQPAWGILSSGGQSPATLINGTADAEYTNSIVCGSSGQISINLQCQNVVGASAAFSNISLREAVMGPLGLLVEEQRTNELVVSEDFSTASWAKTNCTVAAGGATSVMSGGAVFKVIEDTTNAAHQTNAVTGTPASSTAYTASVYARAAERGFAHLQVNTAGATSPVASLVFSLSSAGVVTEFDTGLTVRNVANTDAGGGWRRLSFTVTTPASCTMVALYTGPALNSNTRSYAGTAGSGVFVGQPQLEQGQSVSSYIPTYGTAATRASDVATLAVAGWLSPQRGTFVAQVRTPAVVNPGGNIPNTLMDLGIDGANRMQLRHEIAGTRPLVINAGASVFDSIVPNPAASSVVRFGFAYRPGSGDVSGQGAAANDSAVTYFNLAAATLHIGRGNWGGEIYNGHIQRLTYYPTDLTTAQLNRLTT